MQLAKSSLVGKAAARPDLVRRVISNVRKEGLKPTLEKVFAKLDTPIPLGYSLVGEVVAIGRNVAGYSLGDRVACAGAGLANHAEFNAVPKNLTVAVPDGRRRRGRELRHAGRHRAAGRAAGGADARRNRRRHGPRVDRPVDGADPESQRLRRHRLRSQRRSAPRWPRPSAPTSRSASRSRDRGRQPHRRTRRRRGDRHRVVEIERAGQHRRRDFAA